MSRKPRICYAGTYERAYPRNRLVIDALRAAGARVEEAHAPLVDRVNDKSRIGPLAGLLLAARAVVAYLLLIPNVALRLLRCDALALGYIGQLDALVLGPLARLCRKPVIFNPLVTLTDTLVEDRQRLREGSFAARIVATLDRRALGLADVVIVDTIENGDFLTRRFGVEPDRLVVVPAGADERVFFPGPQEGDSGPLDVVFIGKFIPLHGIETILRAAALLERRDAPVTIELVGTGQTYRAMRELATRLGIGASTLTWTDWIPYDALGDRLRRADVALGIFDTGPKAARVVPNKVFQSLACGVATITADTPAARRLLRDGESALLVPPGDPEALAAAIERLRSPALRSTISSGGLAAFQTHASGAALARAFAPVLDRIAR